MIRLTVYPTVSCSLNAVVLLGGKPQFEQVKLHTMHIALVFGFFYMLKIFGLSNQQVITS